MLQRVRVFAATGQTRHIFRLTNKKKAEEENSARTTELVNEATEELGRQEEEVELKRNKSRLQPQHRNILHGIRPFDKPAHFSHGTLRYARLQYGRYGAASGVDPALCWPTRAELEAKREYENVAHPFTIPEMIEAAAKQRREKEERIRTRQQDIARKMEKVEEWKIELHRKIEKKSNEAVAAKQKKERLMEEVRMHFGYTVDPKDEKFKEMLEKKEKEQKKAEKEARKKAREESMLARMLSKKASKGKSDAAEAKNEEPPTS